MGMELPAGVRTAINIGVDFDAHSAWMGTMGRTSPAYLSRGEFDAEVGLPRVLEALRSRGIHGTFFTPTHTMQTFPEAFERVLKAGHEIAAHGCWHEPIMQLDQAEELRLLELQIEQHVRIVGRAPLGYRSPAWDFTEATLGFLETHNFVWDSSLMGRDLEPYRPRAVTVSREGANTFGPPSSLLEFPPSWQLDDWPVTEYVPGVSAGMGDPVVMHRRWMDHVLYAHERVRNAVVVITVHPQAIGRPGYILMFERFLDEVARLDGVLFSPLSELVQWWRD